MIADVLTRFTARAMVSAVLAYRRRRPSSFHHRGALKRGSINQYSRTMVEVIYSAIRGDH